MEEQKKKKLIIVVAFGVIVAIIYCLFSNVSCSASSKIEVTSEPKMTADIGSLGLSPKVTATVRNKSNSTIDVQLCCSIYDKNGNVTTNISSLIMTLGAGQSTTLTAQGYVEYSLAEYSTKCASFGNVEYKLL